MKVIILEGPAGSGKSTLARTLHEELGIPRVKPLKLPRVINSPEEGLAWSLGSDFLKAIEVLRHRNTDPTVVVDRWIISQWVYNQLRIKQATRLTPRMTQPSFTMQVIRLMDAVHEAWTFRDKEVGQVQTVLLWTLLLPSQERLRYQREKSGKEYRADMYQERLLYRSAAQWLELEGGAPIVTIQGRSQHDGFVSYLKEWLA